MLTAILICVLILCITAIKHIQWKLSYWERKGVQTLKPLFLLGNAKSMLAGTENVGFSIRRITEYFKRQQVRFCGYYFSIKPIFVPIDLDLIRKMLITDFDHFIDRPFSNHDADPLSTHLFALKGSKWKNMRARLAPAFTKSKTKMIFPTLQTCIDNLLEILNKTSATREAVEIKDLSSRLTIDILALCGFGLEANSLKNENSEFLYYSKAILHTSIKQTIIRLFMILCPEALKALKVDSIPDHVAKFFIRSTHNTVKYRETNNIIRNDFMHLLIQIKNNVTIVDDDTGDICKTKEIEDSLSINEIAANSFVFFVAGYESSSSTVSFCLYELCLNESFQNKARADIVNAVKTNNGTINYDVLSHIPYIQKCVKETLRKYPILPFLFRTCTKPYRIPDSDVVLEKDTTCLISTLSLHYDPDVYPNPEQFNPERFSGENINERDSLNWIPFGSGPRICIAYQFGLMQIKSTLASLLLNYKFSLNPKTTVPIVIDPRALQTSAKGGIWLDVEKISR